MFVVVVGFADFFSLDALKTYALGRAVVTLFNYLGWYAAFYLEGAWGALFNSQVSLLIVFIAVEVLSVGLIVAIIKAQKSIELDKADGCAAFDESGAMLATSTSSRTEVAGETGSADGSLQAACRRIGEEHGLSKRELDVFVLLARGYASASIQKSSTLRQERRTTIRGTFPLSSASIPGARSSSSSTRRRMTDKEERFPQSSKLRSVAE